MAGLSSEDIEKKISKAQSITLDFLAATSHAVRQLVTKYAASIGCPKEFFLLPLQSIAAHFMGPTTCVQVNSGWVEPIILWSEVLA